MKKLINTLKTPWGISIGFGAASLITLALAGLFIGQRIGYSRGHTEGFKLGIENPIQTDTEYVSKSEFDTVSKNYFDLLKLYNECRTPHQHNAEPQTPDIPPTEKL